MNNSLKLLFMLNIADISLTKYLTNHGAQELNPIINYLLSVNFFWALAFKIVMVGAFIYVVINVRGQIKSIRPMVAGVNIFFLLLVLYQIAGVLAIS